MESMKGIIRQYDNNTGAGIVADRAGNERFFVCTNALRSALEVGDSVVVTFAYDGHNDYVVRESGRTKGAIN